MAYPELHNSGGCTTLKIYAKNHWINCFSQLQFLNFVREVDTQCQADRHMERALICWFSAWMLTRARSELGWSREPGTSRPKDCSWFFFLKFIYFYVEGRDKRRDRKRYFSIWSSLPRWMEMRQSEARSQEQEAAAQAPGSSPAAF